MKIRYTLVTFVIATLIIPNIVFAVWWNPLSWFRKSVPVSQLFSSTTQPTVEELLKKVETLQKQIDEKGPQLSQTVEIPEVIKNEPKQIIKTSVTSNDNSQLKKELEGLRNKVAKEEACRSADSILKEAHDVYDSGVRRITSEYASINELVSIIASTSQEYKIMSEDYNLLCPVPTRENIITYCMNWNSHLTYHNHTRDYSLSDDPETRKNRIFTCGINAKDLNGIIVSRADWQNNIDNLITTWTKECGRMNKNFSAEYITLQKNYNRLLELQKEYDIQAKLCKQ